MAKVKFLNFFNTHITLYPNMFNKRTSYQEYEYKIS